MAVLNVPVLELLNAPIPKAVLKPESQILGQACACAAGESANHTRATASEMRRKLRRKGERLREFIIAGVFIIRFFPFPLSTPRKDVMLTFGPTGLVLRPLR